MSYIKKEKINLGVIGYRNHAKRLIDLLETKKNCVIKAIYHPYKSLNLPNATNQIEDLMACDAVIIASPNHTHLNYITQFTKNSFTPYLFCEKPPVTTLEALGQLESLSQIHKKRIFFNYNYRFSFLNEILKNQYYKRVLGEIVHIYVISTHGLAFKEGYADSWRADGSKSLHAIAETVGIHYVDLFNYHFGLIEEYLYRPNLISGIGSAYDTALIQLAYPQITTTIMVSYACPNVEEVTIIGTNGFLCIKDDELRIYSPRDTFDSNGFFVSPPLVVNTSLNIQEDYINSLSKSLDFFIEHVQQNKTFDLRFFTASISSNYFILSLQSNHKKEALNQRN